MLTINDHKEQAQRRCTSSLSSRATVNRYKSVIYIGFTYLGRTEVGQIKS